MLLDFWQGNHSITSLYLQTWTKTDTDAVVVWDLTGDTQTEAICHKGISLNAKNAFSSAKDVFFFFLPVSICLFVGWFVSTIIQTLLNRFPQNCEGGWVFFSLSLTFSISTFPRESRLDLNERNQVYLVGWYLWESAEGVSWALEEVCTQPVKSVVNNLLKPMQRRTKQVLFVQLLTFISSHLVRNVLWVSFYHNNCIYLPRRICFHLFLFNCWLVGLSAPLHKNYWMDFHETWPREKTFTPE